MSTISVQTEIKMGKPNKQGTLDLAVQHNKVIAGRYEMTLVQKRIFLLVLKQISPNDEELKTYEIRVKDLLNIGGSDNLYDRLKEEVKKMMEQVIGIENEREWEYSGLISFAKYTKKEGILQIEIHPKMRDYFLQLKRDFTPVPIQEILKCSSVYGQRFYELLYRFRDTGVWHVSVQKLREILVLEDKYSNFTDFRRYVLKQAQRDLADTNLNFTWKEKKAQGSRRIERLEFQIDIRPENMELPFPDQYNIRQRLKNQFKLEPWQVNRIIEFLMVHSEKQKRVTNLLYDIQIKEGEGEIRNLPAYTWKALQQDLDLNSHNKN